MVKGSEGREGEGSEYCEEGRVRRMILWGEQWLIRRESVKRKGGRRGNRRIQAEDKGKNEK